VFEYTPGLKRLSMYIISIIGDDYIPSPIPRLIDLNIGIAYATDTSKIISFLQNTPNLRRLSIRLWSNLTDGHQWKQIIRNYLPKLKVFQLKMEDKCVDVHNIEEQVNELVNSFRSSFWIDEHQWFIRCFTSKSTINLYNLSERFYYREYNFPDSLQSTYPHDDEQQFYNNMIFIYNDKFFDSSISSNIRLSNIQNLRIKLPINDRFWSIVTSLKRLYSIRVSSHTDTF